MKERSPVKNEYTKIDSFYRDYCRNHFFSVWRFMTIVLCISMAEADAMYGGLADFCKYKENVFCPAFFWINCYTDRNQLLEK